MASSGEAGSRNGGWSCDDDDGDGDCGCDDDADRHRDDDDLDDGCVTNGFTKEKA